MWTRDQVLADRPLVIKDLVNQVWRDPFRLTLDTFSECVLGAMRQLPERLAELPDESLTLLLADYLRLKGSRICDAQPSAMGDLVLSYEVVDSIGEVQSGCGMGVCQWSLGIRDYLSDLRPGSNMFHVLVSSPEQNDTVEGRFRIVGPMEVSRTIVALASARLMVTADFGELRHCIAGLYAFLESECNITKSRLSAVKAHSQHWWDRLI